MLKMLNIYIYIYISIHVCIMYTYIFINSIPVDFHSTKPSTRKDQICFANAKLL